MGGGSLLAWKQQQGKGISLLAKQQHLAVVWAMHRVMTETTWPGLESLYRDSPGVGLWVLNTPCGVLGHGRGRAGPATNPFSRKM